MRASPSRERKAAEAAEKPTLFTTCQVEREQQPASGHADRHGSTQSAMLKRKAHSGSGNGSTRSGSPPPVRRRGDSGGVVPVERRTPALLQVAAQQQQQGVTGEQLASGRLQQIQRHAAPAVQALEPSPLVCQASDAHGSITPPSSPPQPHARLLTCTHRTSPIIARLVVSNDSTACKKPSSRQASKWASKPASNYAALNHKQSSSNMQASYKAICLRTAIFCAHWCRDHVVLLLSAHCHFLCSWVPGSCCAAAVNSFLP